MPLALLIFAILFRRQARALVLVLALIMLFVGIHFYGTYEDWLAACNAGSCPR